MALQNILLIRFPSLYADIRLVKIPYPGCLPAKLSNPQASREALWMPHHLAVSLADSILHFIIEKSFHFAAGYFYQASRAAVYWI